MAVDHLGVVLAISRSVHGELEVLQAVVLRQEGHEGGQCVGWRCIVGEDFGQVGFPAVGAGDVLGYGDGQWGLVAVGEGHLDVLAVEVVDGRGGGGYGRVCSYGEWLGLRFPRCHYAPPQLLVDTACRLFALDFQTLTRINVRCDGLRQFDGKGTRFGENLVAAEDLGG